VKDVYVLNAVLWFFYFKPNTSLNTKRLETEREGER